MNILVLGSGGREHALVWKINQSPMVKKLYCVPGNAGTAAIAESTDISLNNFRDILSFIEEKEIDFTVIGPEQPLVEGIVDFLESHGKLVFGPNQMASRMEGSKIFSKNLMKKYSIPTAEYGAFATYEDASKYLKSLNEGKIVVKADGLAAGKGSIVCNNFAEALKSLEAILVQKIFREAGQQVVIEEYMEGQEASLFVLTDSENYVVLSPAQDFKRALDNDLGKNTGGMGSYAPTPVLTDSLYQLALKDIIESTLEGLNKEGIKYRGVLYCGLMLTSTGPKVVEFNCRFGDPETQVVLPLLDTDLMEILLATANNELGNLTVKLKEEYAVCVVAASGGYPDSYEKGKVIYGLNDTDSDVMVFHAGTLRKSENIVTSGGRVLAVTATDPSLKEAAEKSYRNLRKIQFEDIYFRKDIAEKAWKHTI
jgi:phosphoribosylamine--glycine ligase